MPEPPQMPDTRDPRDLDGRIRDLVAHAVADAPAPPEIGATDVPLVAPDHHGHRRWWVGGGAALLAAAAAIAVLTLVGNTDEAVDTPPATEPTVAPTPAPTPAPEPTPAPTTTPSTTTTTLPAPNPAGTVLTAGSDGVVEHGGGGPRTLTTEPMVFALATGDGRVIVQRRAGDGTARGWTDEDTVPLVLGDGGSLTPLFDTADWDGGVVLHDVEVVDGRRLLLFTLQVVMSNPEAADESLYVVDLATQDRVSLGSVGGWEASTGRLHLATTGLIVGEELDGPGHKPLVTAVPGSPAAADEPTAASLGWEEDYGDCFECPRDFTVSADGTTVAWVRDTPPVLDTRPVDPPGEVEPFPTVPDTEPRYVDLRSSDRAALIAYHEPESAGGPAPPPVVVEADGTVTTLEGVAATFSPAGGATAPACGVDPEARAITDHVDDVPPALDGSAGWIYTGDGNYDPCAQLSYALVETRGGTGSSPVQVMLFNEGEYVGTATECSFGFTTITATTADSVTVEYRWPREGDSNATPSGLATVTYRWDGGAVRAMNELDQELRDVTGCN